MEKNQNEKNQIETNKSEKKGSGLVLNIIDPKDIIDNSWTIIDIARRRPSIGWEPVFKHADNELKDTSDIIEQDKIKNGRFYPDCKNIFRAFDLTPLDRVKVVIVGQDPYHGANPDGTPQATGLCFSVKKGVPIPPSLRNIFKEIRDTVEGFQTPSHGNLERWARQGVLMMNACLTVRPHEAGSHGIIWSGFIKKVINAILDVNPGCIFVLWGREADKIKKKMLGERAVTLETSHPSGFSAYRGFFGCNHFNEINKLLLEQGRRPIDWNLV